MMQRFLLDTNIISEPIRENPSQAVLERLNIYGHFCALSSISWHELNYGYERLPSSKRKDKIKHYLDLVVSPAFPILPYNSKSSEIHGVLRASRERGGNPLLFADAQIASIALENNLILVTRNTKDFLDIPNLRVENWFEPPSKSQ